MLLSGPERSWKQSKKFDAAESAWQNRRMKTEAQILQLGRQLADLLLEEVMAEHPDYSLEQAKKAAAAKLRYLVAEGLLAL